MLKWTFRAFGLSHREQQQIKNTSVDDLIIEKIKKKLDEFDKILIPINIEEFHWYLVCIFLKQKLVLILDSLPTTVNRYQTTVQNICNWYNGINTILYGKAMPEKTMDSSWRVALNLKLSSGKQESTTTKETSNHENTKSHDEEHEDQKASHQLIQETIEKLKIQKLRRDQGLEIEDDFSGDSNIWIKSQINYYIN